MTTGFGRKGVSSTAAMPSSPMPAGGMRARGVPAASPAARAEPAQAGGEPMSSQMAAFLAEERARRASEGGSNRQDYVGDIERLPITRAKAPSDRSMIMAYVWWYFCSPFAVHRFYLRSPQSAFAMLGLFWGGLAMGLATGSGWPAVLIGLWFLWIIADLFLIPGMVRRANEPSAHLAFT